MRVDKKTNSEIRTNKERLVMENFASIMQKLDATFLIESDESKNNDTYNKNNLEERLEVIDVETGEYGPITTSELYMLNDYTSLSDITPIKTTKVGEYYNLIYRNSPENIEIYMRRIEDVLKYENPKRQPLRKVLVHSGY